MTERFYQPGPARAEKVKALFGRIAARYDLINDLQSLGLHRAWKRRLVQMAKAHPGALALDVCCGTGDLTLTLAAQGMTVTGLDFTEEMLVVARSRADAHSPSSNQPTTRSSLCPETGQRGQTRFVQGDAMALPFDANTFDVVTVGYGLRNLADWHVGLREMHRVAKPGGRVLVLDFGKPENALLRALYFAYLKLVVPVFGWVFCGSAGAYSYILESLKHYPAQAGVAAAMRELRMTNVRVHQILGGAMSINYGEKAG